MKKLLLVAAMAATSTTAFAATSATPEVDFTGARAEICEVRNFNNSVNFGALSNLGAGNAKTDNLSLFCNVKFQASLKSENGFLKLVTSDTDAVAFSQSNLAASGYSSFAAALDYKITSPLGVNNTTQIGAGNTVPYGPERDPIDTPAQITWETIPGTLPLLGGTYTDTVTLTLTPNSF